MCIANSDYVKKGMDRAGYKGTQANTTTSLMALCLDVNPQSQPLGRTINKDKVIPVDAPNSTSEHSLSDMISSGNGEVSSTNSSIRINRYKRYLRELGDTIFLGDITFEVKYGAAALGIASRQNAQSNCFIECWVERKRFI